MLLQFFSEANSRIPPLELYTTNKFSICREHWTHKALRYCWSSCSVPGVAGWLGAAGCGFPTISTCGETEHLKKKKESNGMK